ncbi:MBG domain-containing protein [Pedosphaera parvula]|uniref:Uncharacterized protein n=1 Tax=Pedosphaera parvula (strain Ellin514) TaxID=320771 RepID=B9XL77_PEDPL|nr:MBG domain-containing protein [Pedosphaera parvula]EEF59428.1 hypothetical protein Cflav_PD2272 [Pedosphaera parvula Ellin514]
MKIRSILSLLAAVFTLMFAWQVVAQTNSPTVVTDQEDYAPGSTVYITATGFSPNEIVQLRVLHVGDDGDGDNTNSPAHQPWQATADDTGSFQTTWLVPADQDELGATLQLTATGLASGLIAQAIFTDGPFATLTVGPQASPVNAGQSTTFLITLGGKSGGNSVNINLSVTNLPAGATGVFSPNNFSSASSSTTSTLTITTTALTPASVTNFTVTESTSLLSGTGTLTVSAGAATMVRVETKANGTGTLVPAQAFGLGTSALTVYAISRDSQSNFVANVAATAWTLQNVTGGVVSGDLVPSADKKSATFTPNHAGTATIHATSGALTTTDSGTLTVNKATPTITWTNPAAITYGTSLSSTQLNATATVPGTFSYTPPAGTILGVGNQNLSVTFTPTDTTDYNTATATATATVSKAVLTVTANNASRSYGSANPSFTASYSGFVNGETLGTSGVTGSPALTTTATTNSSVSGSPYIITAAAGSLVSSNYSFTFANGQLTLTKAALTVTANNATRAYGSADPVFTASYSGFLNGETLGTSGITGSPALTTTATTNSPVSGSPYTITASAGTLSSGNYSFTFANGQLSVTKANSTISVATSANPSPTGSNVTLTTTIATTALNVTAPSGSVQFKSDGSPLGSPVTIGGGIASITSAALSHGSHTITAEYAGDSNFSGSTNNLAAQLVINISPVTRAFSLAANQDSPASFSLSKLLKTVFDADADVIALSSLSATSANGGSITLNNQVITYNPPAGSTNSDSFTYVVNDGQGASATGTVTVTIKGSGPTQPAQNITGFAILGNGHAVTKFAGIPGRDYTVQASTNLINWLNIGSATAGTNGQFQFEDANAPSFPSRYYRTIP